MPLATKSIKQRFQPSAQMLEAMECFRQMTNDCIRIGMRFEEENGGRSLSMKKLSLLSYTELRKRYGGYSGYALCASSKATGILSARKKSIKRGHYTRKPYLSRPVLVSCYGFSIESDNLIIHLGSKTSESIPLNAHTRTSLSDPSLKVRSFTLTEDSLSLCVSKVIGDTNAPDPAGTIGIDRNLRNLMVGNSEAVTHYDMTEIVNIGENANSIIRSFKRSDARIRGRIASKYGRRRRDRTRQLLNLVSKRTVKEAKERSQAIIFEEIRGIRNLYKRGKGQRRSFRATMNSWPFYEIKRQIEYKAAWEGVPVITLTRSETRGTTMDCPRCGERLQAAVRGDEEHYRQLWCEVCKRWRDRDLVAVLNISHRGWLRFDHSQGEAGEAVKGNPREDGRSLEEPVILRVDASKLHQPVPLMQQNRP